MKSRRIADGFLVRLERGEEVIAELTAFAADKKIPWGFLQGIGAIREVTLGYFDTDTNRYRTKRIRETVEVVSLIGNISHLDNKPSIHAHIVVAGPEQRLLGGHFIEGTVAVTLEIIVTVISTRLVRTPDTKTGYALWDL